MATLREYFDTDFATLLKQNLEIDWATDSGGGQVSVRVHLDFDSNAKFLSLYLPDEACQPGLLEVLLPEVDAWLVAGAGLEVRMGRDGETERLSSELRFAGRLFIYHNADIGEEAQAAVRQRASERGVNAVFRGPQFALGRAKYERPLAFISHDSRDKADIARPLAVALSAQRCPVWFDEFSLKVGDRLRESIERGLRETAKCIVVITPNFLANTGWTREEFGAVFTRELIEKKDVILPVWSGVTREQVFNYSPVLADRLAANWSDGQDAVVRKLRQAIGP